MAIITKTAVAIGLKREETLKANRVTLNSIEFYFYVLPCAHGDWYARSRQCTLKQRRPRNVDGRVQGRRLQASSRHWQDGRACVWVLLVGSSRSCLKDLLHAQDCTRATLASLRDTRCVVLAAT